MGGGEHDIYLIHYLDWKCLDLHGPAMQGCIIGEVFDSRKSGSWILLQDHIKGWKRGVSTKIMGGARVNRFKIYLRGKIHKA